MKDFKQILEDTVQTLDYTDIHLEIGWQIELVIKLRQKLGSKYKIIPENKENTNIKKELDIAVFENDKHKYAIELKMPQNNAFNRRWPNAEKDIDFLIELTTRNKNPYKRGYLIFLTPNQCFQKQNNIHSHEIQWRKLNIRNSEKWKFFILEVINHPVHPDNL